MTIDDKLRQLTAEVHAAAKIALGGAELELAALLVNAHGSLLVLGAHPRDDSRTRDAIRDAESALEDWRRSHDVS